MPETEHGRPVRLFDTIDKQSVQDVKEHQSKNIIVGRCFNDVVGYDPQQYAKYAARSTFPNACRINCTLPVCGDGVADDDPPPPGFPEDCDDGNVTDFDCCATSCLAEDLGTQMCGTGACVNTVPICVEGQPNNCIPLPPPSGEGPIGDPTCGDAIDNDCDGLIDGADLDCQ